MIVYAVVEGESEEQLIRNFAYSCLYTFFVSKDFLEFHQKYLDHPEVDLLFINYAEGVDRIPHLINEEWHNICRFEDVKVLLICDSEKQFSIDDRINEIKGKLDSCVECDNFEFIITQPMIENVFLENKPIIQKILSELHREIYETSHGPEFFDLSSYNGNDKHTLKQIHSDFGLRYKEKKFAEKFFGKLCFESCVHPTVSRLKSEFNVS